MPIPTATHHSQTQAREKGRFTKKGDRSNSVDTSTALTAPTSRPSQNAAIYNPPYTSPVGNTAAAIAGVDGRFSRPTTGGGLYGQGVASFTGVVARRSWDTESLQWMTACRHGGGYGLNEWGMVAPLILLRVLAYLHPLASHAMANNLDLAFSPDDVRIVGVEMTERPDGTQTEKQNSEATAALTLLWDRMDTLQPELGGWRGLLRSNARRGMDAGMAVLEGVPSLVIGDGLRAVYTVDPLTCRFRDTDQGRVLEQRQFGSGQPVRLPSERVFHSALDGDTDNPYGEPLFKAFPFDGLADFREQGNLADLMQGVIWPRLSFSFPLLEITQYAQEQEATLLIGRGGGTDPNTGLERDLTPTEYAMNAMQAYKEQIATMGHNASLYTIKGGDVKPIDLAAGLVGMDPAMQRRMIRIASSLRHPATMLNIPVGGTQGLGVTNFRAYAKQLESIRAFAAGPLLQIANLHLRLMGLPFTARLKAEKIQTTDKLADAQAEEVSLRNTLTKRNQNWISNEEASIEATGSGPNGDPPALPDPATDATGTNVPPENATSTPKDTTQNADKAKTNADK